jgi:hypothetical protein
VSRILIPYEPTWLDRNFKKEFRSLSDAEQASCEEVLGNFMEDLQKCKHPIQDPILRKWRPSNYRGVVSIKRGHLAEYRLTNTLRVIACYFEDREELLLVVATIRHDHDRMKRLLREHGRYLPNYTTPS